MRRTLRSGVALAVAACATTASAGTYVGVDLVAAERFGNYRWANHGTSREGAVDAVGPILEGAIGGTTRRWFSIAGEGGLGFFSSGSKLALTDVKLARVGVRVEARCRYPLFARFATGVEWLGFGLAQLGPGDSGGVEGDPARGPYAALSIGGRGKHFGGFVRAELARATSAHATYTPFTLGAGLDVAWF